MTLVVINRVEDEVRRNWINWKNQGQRPWNKKSFVVFSEASFFTKENSLLSLALLIIKRSTWIINFIIYLFFVLFFNVFRRHARNAEAKERIFQELLEEVKALFARSSVTVSAHQQPRLPLLRPNCLSRRHFRIGILNKIKKLLKKKIKKRQSEFSSVFISKLQVKLILL